MRSVMLQINEYDDDDDDDGTGSYAMLPVPVPLYADDVCLISGSCFCLQKMLDICTTYGVIWDISFNPAKSHLATFGDSNPELFN